MYHVRKLILLLVTVFSVSSAQSQGTNVYRYTSGVTVPDLVGVEKPLDGDADKKETSVGCYLAENIGTVGEKGVCEDRLIVDNSMLYNLVATNGDYSDEAVFTGQVTDMFRLFKLKSPIHSISGWDTGNVTNMAEMFAFTRVNHDISNWDTSKVANTSSMFASSIFNHADVINWDMSNVKNMDVMFGYSSFNADIGNWDTSSVTSMTKMFVDTPFNQDITNWCMANIQSIPNEFSSVLSPENQPYWGVCPSKDALATADCYDPVNLNKVGSSGFCKGKIITSNDKLREFVNTNSNYSDDRVFTGQVTDMFRLFKLKSPIHSISGWDTGNVTNMAEMFAFTRVNHDISNWDTSKVANTSSMFASSIFNHADVINWDMSNVKNMDVMFGYSSFNADIGNWDTSSVTSMTKMFVDTPFNQDITNWCVFSIKNRPSKFASSLSSVNEPLWGTCPSN